MSFRCLILLLILPTTFSYPQDSLSVSRFSIVVAASAGLLTAAHVQNYNSWWKGERGAFHFREDGGQYLGADKAGHLFFTYVASDVFARSLEWSGVERRTALFAGGLTALAFQLYVETEDGFTKSLGFSATDAAADILGAWYPLLQEEKPWFQHFHLKWSVIPSERYRRGSHHNIIDDYESMYFWVSTDLRALVPASVHRVIPSFLCLALGYGVKNIDARGEREIYFGLDIDFTRLPGKGSFLGALKHGLNYFRFPAPTIRITPSVILYGVRF